MGYFTKNVTVLSVSQYVAIGSDSTQMSLHIQQVSAQLYSSWLQLSPGKVEGDMNPQSTAGLLCLSLMAKECKCQKKKTNTSLHLGFLN